MLKGVLLAAVVTAAAPFQAEAADALLAAQAARHIGETATVCGTVASAHYSVRSRRKPTFLNLDRPYPNQVFTVLIWGEDRSKFGAPEATFQGKRICARGLIESYQGTPEIIARDPRQVTVQ